MNSSPLGTMTARASFRQDDLARAIRAVQNAGLGIARVKVSPDGRWFAIEIGLPETIRSNNSNPWDLEFDET